MFDLLKGMFFEQEVPKPSQNDTTAQTPTHTQSTGGFTSSGPVLDPNLMQHLRGIIIKRRTPFTSLLEAGEKLRSIIPDDVTRLKAAAVSIGDKNAILQAVDIHINDLDAQADEFQRFADSEASSKIGTLKTKTANCEQAATAADQRVQQLQQEIQTLQAQAAQNRADAAQSQAAAQNEQLELDRKTQSFAAALSATKNSLLQQKSVLSTSL